MTRRASARLVLVLAVITLLGAAFRFWRIDQLPPGLHYDEAFNVLSALRMVKYGTWPIFFGENFGQEPLHIWLIALLFRITGPIPIGGRLVSALAGAMTVPFLCFTVTELFRERYGLRRAIALGLVSSLSLALLYWHAHYSRIGMEPNMVPAVAVPAFGFTWRAVRTRSRRDVVIAGVLLGASLYTYAPGRFVPVFAALFFTTWSLASREFLRANWRVLLCTGLVALVVFLPLAAFFATNPEWFTMRTSQVVQTNAMDGVYRVVRGLFVRGDLNHRQNLPGRPALDPFQAVLFLIGIGACLVSRTPGHLFLLTWFGVMILPSALTDFPPHFGRMLGAAPAASGLIALGADAAYGLSRRFGRGRPRLKSITAGGAFVLLTIGFTFSGIRAAYDYFYVWASSEDLFIAFDTGFRWIGEYVAGQPESEEVYISPVDRFYTTLKYFFDDDPYLAHNYNGRRCVVYPSVTTAPTSHVVVVLEDQNSMPFLESVFPEGRIVNGVDLGDEPYARVYRTPAGLVARTHPTQETDVDFAGKIRLLGYDLPEAPATPGETLSLRLYWRAETSMEEWYKVFVQLWGKPTPVEGGRIWGQEDVYPCDNSYHTPWWSAGEIIADEYRLPVDLDAPTGEYQVVVGFYQDDGPRLPILDSAGNPTSDHTIVTTVEVVQP